MSSWPERLETAIGMWRQGDLDGATAVLREVVVSGDATVIPEASQLLGRVLQDSGDLDGARAAHRSVIASGHPMFAQRSAISLALMLVDDEQWALACRPLRLAAAGADADLAVMADVALVRVLRTLGDLDGAAEALTRARRSDHPGVAELTEGMEDARWPEDGGERERQAWEAFEAIVGLLDAGEDDDEDEDGADDEIILTGLNKMLAHGLPELCSQAAFRLYSIYADRAEFEDCRRVMEHAIAVGDPTERGLAEKLLGAVLFDLGEHVEARDAYRRAAEDHRPEIRLDALIQESKFTRELGDEEGARAILWRVVESGHPRFALEARACLGQVYSEAGDVDEAVGCWRVVLGSESEFHQGAVACLGMLLHGLPGDDPRRAEVVALLRQATELDDSDVAFQAQMTLTYAESAVRGPDEELEQAVDDCDAALELIRADDLAQARTLLHRVIDAEIPGQSARACAMLATLEYGEGDLEQAHELLEYVADGDDYANGFAAAVNRHLISEGGVPHPVLSALVGYQRLGREAGVAAYQECAGHPDPAVSALAKSTLAQVYVSLGVPRSQGVELLDEAAAAGDPLALSHAAVISFLIRDGDIRDGDEGEAVVDLLRRAHAHGHPALAPWVAQALGTALERQDEAEEALAAYTAVCEHPGLGVEAEARMLHILESRRDLPGVAAVHERIVARGDRLRAPRSAWLLGFTRVRMDDLDAARRAFDQVSFDQVSEDHPELAEDGVFARGLLGHDFAGASAVLAALREQDDAARSFMNTWLALEAAHAWQRAGDAASADAALSLAVACGHPERVQEAALFLGALRNDAGDHAGAAEAWAVAADGDDEHRALLGAKSLGEALAALGDLNGAVTAYRRALDALDPDDDDYVQVMDILTQLLVAAGRVTEARELQVVATGDGPHVHLVIGAALEEAGELDAAAAEYRQAIDGSETESMLGSGPDSEVAAMASVMLARVLDRRGEAGDAEGARAAYERAATADDPYIRITAQEGLGTANPHELALLRLHEDDRAGALELFTQAYGSPVVAELHITLSEGELTAIRPLLERATNDEARHAEKAADLVLGVALERLRAGADEARELYELVVEFGTPEQVAIACDNFGHVYDLAGDTDAAAETLALGAAVDHPAALSCLRRLLGVLALQGDVEALEAAARRAVASGDPETVTLGTWTLSDLAKARGDLAGAAAGYRDTIDGADPDTLPYLRVELGRTLHQLGETAAAHRELEAVLTCDNTSQVLLAGVQLGAWLAEDGRLAGAAEAFGAAAAAGLRHPDPEELDHDHHGMALNNLAAVAYQADEAGDHTVAVRALHLAAAGGAFDDAVQLAREYASGAAERGDLDAVRTYYRGAAAFPPDGDPHLLLELAELLTERGAPADPEVREPQPPRAEAAPAAGLMRDQSGTPADRTAREAVADDPAQARELRSLMLAQLQAKDFDGVAATAQRAVTSGDTETVAAGYWMWGDSRRHRGDTDAAVRLYRQAIGTGSEELGPRVRVDLARTLRERGEGEEARAELGRAAEAGDPDIRAQAGNLLGKWAFEDGDLAAAAEAFGRVAAIEMGPDDPDLLSELVEMAADNVIVVADRAFTEGDHQVAVRALALAAQAGEAQEALNIAGRRATELAEAGERASAMLYIESAVGFLPDPDPDLEIQLADLYAAAGEPAEARARYERLIDHPDAHVRLVAGGRLVPLLRVAGDTSGLADVTQRMTDDSAETGLDTGAESGEPTSLFTLGQALVDAGEIEEARTVLGRVAESDSRLSRRALVMLGRTYQDEDAGRARELYLRVVGSAGEADGTATVIAKMYLGALAKRDRDWPQALRWYQQVIDSGEEKQAPLAAAHLGELAYWLGDRGSAVRYYELTLATDTRQPDLVGEAAYRLGEIRHGDGDLDLARKHLRQAVESGDEDFAAQARALLTKLGEQS